MRFWCRQMKSATAVPPASTTRSHSQPMRRACSIRSAGEKPRSRLISRRTSSALKWTAPSRGTRTLASVVLPAPGRPISRILRRLAPCLGPSGMSVQPLVWSTSISIATKLTSRKLDIDWHRIQSKYKGNKAKSANSLEGLRLGATCWPVVCNRSRKDGGRHGGYRSPIAVRESPGCLKRALR